MNHKRKGSPSSDFASSSTARKQSRISVYETAAQIAANGMISLGTSVLEAQQVLASSLESKLTQSIKILTELKSEGAISSCEYLQICQKFRTENENYSEIFMGMMTTDNRLEWLSFEGLLS